MRLNVSAVVLVVLVGLGCKSTSLSQPQAMPDVRLEHKDVTDNNGTILASVETVYRGRVRVLDTVRYAVARGKYSSGGWFRIYRVNGQPMLFEEDTKGDGKIEMRLYPKSNALASFEAFRREPNGTVKPIDSKELEELRREGAALDE